MALFVLVFAVDVACPNGMTADSIRAVAVGVSIVHWHTIALSHLQPLLDPGQAVTVAHGQIYPFFPWAVSLFSVPWIVGSDLLHKLGLGEGSVAMVRSTHDWGLQIVSMASVIAGTAVFVYFTALELLRVGSRARMRRWSLGVALAFVFTTSVWSTAGRSMWQQGPSILCISAALFFAVRAESGRRGFAAMGASLAVAYAVRPTDIIPLVLLLAWVMLAHPRRLPSAIAGAALPAAVFVTVNLVAYHQVLSPYYTGGQGFAVSGTMAKALAGNLVSPARGLVWYCPLVFLSIVGVVVKRRAGELTRLWQVLAVIPVLHWVVISSFKHWWGGDSYGPRLFTDMLPIFAVLALPAVEWLAQRTAVEVGGGAATRPAGPRRRAGYRTLVAGLVIVAAVWGFAVNAQGAVLRSAWCWNSEPTSVDQQPSKLWQWNDPQFLRGIRTLVWGPDRSTELIRNGVDLYGCPVEAVRP